MARILSGNAHKRIGAPGWKIVSLAGRGGRVAQDTARRLRVRVLVARDPESGIQEAASRGVNPRFTIDPDVPNIVGPQNPEILDGSSGRRRSTPAGRISVRNRATNRRIGKR